MGVCLKQRHLPVVTSVFTDVYIRVREHACPVVCMDVRLSLAGAGPPATQVPQLGAGPCGSGWDACSAGPRAVPSVFFPKQSVATHSPDTTKPHQADAALPWTSPYARVKLKKTERG